MNSESPEKNVGDKIGEPLLGRDPGSHNDVYIENDSVRSGRGSRRRLLTLADDPDSDDILPHCVTDDVEVFRKHFLFPLRSQNRSESDHLDDALGPVLGTDPSDIVPKEVRDRLSEGTKLKLSTSMDRRRSRTVTKTEVVFSLCKGFVAGGILLTPHAFMRGGLLFSMVILFVVFFCCAYGMTCLIDCAERTKLESFADIAEAATGYLGRTCVEMSIGLSQMGFCTVYLIFVATNLKDVILTWGGKCDPAWDISFNVLILTQLVFLLPLSLIQRIKSLAGVIIFADILMITGLLSILGYVLFYNASKPLELPDWILLNNNSHINTISYSQSYNLTIPESNLVVPISFGNGSSMVVRSLSEVDRDAHLSQMVDLDILKPFENINWTKIEDPFIKVENFFHSPFSTEYIPEPSPIGRPPKVLITSSNMTGESSSPTILDRFGEEIQKNNLSEYLNNYSDNLTQGQIMADSPSIELDQDSHRKDATDNKITPSNDTEFGDVMSWGVEGLKWLLHPLVKPFNIAVAFLKNIWDSVVKYFETIDWRFWIFDPATWPTTLGVVAYVFEGSPLVLPFRKSVSTSTRAVYPRILWDTLRGICIFILIFATSCFLAFKKQTAQIVLLNLPLQPWAFLVQIGYSLAIFLSFPLQLHPVSKIIDSFLLGDMYDEWHRNNQSLMDRNSNPTPRLGSMDPIRHTLAREVDSSQMAGERYVMIDKSILKNNIQTMKKIVRICLTLTTFLLALLGASKLDNIVGLIGVLCCVPLSLIYPQLFHLVLCSGNSRTSVTFQATMKHSSGLRRIISAMSLHVWNLLILIFGFCLMGLASYSLIQNSAQDHHVPMRCEMLGVIPRTVQ